MLSGEKLLRATVLSGVPLAIAAEAWPVSARNGRVVMTTEALVVSRAREPAPAATRDIVRVFAVIAIGFTVGLSIIDLWRLEFERGQTGGIRVGMLAALVTIPLHIRHLLYGVRGERPPGGLWTLAIMAAVTVAATPFVGNAWTLEFAPLVVSIVIIVPGRLAILLAAGVCVLPMLFVDTHWYVENNVLGGPYLSLAIAWRSVTQFVPLQLLASLHALDAANRELEARAIVQTRARIDNELRATVGSALQQIIARGEAIRATSAVSSSRASSELQGLVADSRRALSDARRIVAGYRASSVRAELDAATSLIEATGATVRVEVDKGVSLDAPDDSARSSIRGALAKVLRDEPRSLYVIRVRREDGARLAIDISPEDRVTPDARQAT